MQLQDPTTIFTLLMAKMRQSKRKTQNKLAQALRAIIALKKQDSGNQIEAQTDQDKKKATETLKQAKEQLRQLKKELSESFQEQNALYGECRKRVHKDQNENQFQARTEKQSEQFDRAIANFFAARKKLSIAKIVDESRQCKDRNFELALYEEAFKISNDIVQNKLKSLKQWCYDHSPSLAKIKSSLEFKLTCCEFLTILKNSGNAKATQFLRKSISNIYLSQQDKKELKQYTLLILLYQQEEEPFPNILEETNQVFLETFENIYQISFIPKFDKTIGIGMSVLKSISCPNQSHSYECPTCSPTVQKLAQTIPMTMRNQSSLKCRINGSLMGGNNHPMMLPNGNIYSLSGLEETGTSTKYRCPESGKSFRKETCIKAYLS